MSRSRKDGPSQSVPTAQGWNPGLLGSAPLYGAYSFCTGEASCWVLDVQIQIRQVLVLRVPLGLLEGRVRLQTNV